jgi:flavodoxin
MELSQLNIGFFLGGDIAAGEKVGNRIQTQLLKHGIEVDVLDLSEACSKLCECYDFFIFGIPSWNFGYTQQCWEGVEPEFACSNLCGKIAALYVLADSAESEGYFLHAMSWLSDRVTKTGATVVSFWPSTFSHSSCPLAGKLERTHWSSCPQAINVTDLHIESWADHLISECSQLLNELSV